MGFFRQLNRYACDVLELFFQEKERISFHARLGDLSFDDRISIGKAIFCDGGFSDRVDSLGGVFTL